MLEIIFVLAAFGLGFACGRAPDATIKHMGELASKAISYLKWW